MTRLMLEGRRVVGVATPAGPALCDTVVSTQNIWTRELACPMPVVPERHAVLALECAEAPYTSVMPVFKDLSSPGMGHGFKLSPTVGRVLAQEALSLPTDVALKPYSIERFADGSLLAGKYGEGAVS